MRAPNRKIVCSAHGEIRIRSMEKPKYCPVCGQEIPKRKPEEGGNEWRLKQTR